MLKPDLKEPRLKIARAKSHIANVERQCSAFCNSQPHRIYTERDPHGPGYTIKLRLEKPIPDEIALTVGEAIYQLRSSLDVLACCLATANGAKDTKGTYFPFVKDVAEFMLPATQRKIQKLSTTHQQIIHHWKPYREGNNTLWILNQLANIDRHNRLVTVGGFGGSIQSFRLTGGQYFIPANAASRQSLDEDVVLVVGKSGDPPEGEVRVSLAITFREIELIKGQPVVSILDKIANQVECVVDTFGN